MFDPVSRLQTGRAREKNPLNSLVSVVHRLADKMEQKEGRRITSWKEEEIMLKEGKKQTA